VDFQSRFNQSRCKCKCRTQPSLAPLPRRPFSRVRVADTAFPAGFTFGSAKDGRTRGRVAATRRRIGASGTIRSRNLVRRGSHAAFPPRNIERSTYRAGIPRLIGRCDTERKSPVTFARSDKRRVRDAIYIISFRSVRWNARRLRVARSLMQIPASRRILRRRANSESQTLKREYHCGAFEESSRAGSTRDCASPSARGTVVASEHLARFPRRL